MLSPKSQGLFKRAVMQSGSCLNPWSSHLTSSNHLQLVNDLAKKLGELPQNENDLIKFLKQVDPIWLVNESVGPIYTAGSTIKNVDLMWGPIVEDADAKDAILTKTPHEYLYDTSIKQNIDTFHGFNSAVRENMFNVLFTYLQNCFFFF